MPLFSPGSLHLQRNTIVPTGPNSYSTLAALMGQRTMPRSPQVQAKPPQQRTQQRSTYRPPSLPSSVVPNNLMTGNNYVNPSSHRAAGGGGLPATSLAGEAIASGTPYLGFSVSRPDQGGGFGRGNLMGTMQSGGGPGAWQVGNTSPGGGVSWGTIPALDRAYGPNAARLAAMGQLGASLAQRAQGAGGVLGGVASGAGPIGLPNGLLSPSGLQPGGGGTTGASALGGFTPPSGPVGGATGDPLEDLLSRRVSGLMNDPQSVNERERAAMVQRQQELLTARENNSLDALRSDLARRGITSPGGILPSMEQGIRANTSRDMANVLRDIDLRRAETRAEDLRAALGLGQNLTNARLAQQGDLRQLLFALAQGQQAAQAIPGATNPLPYAQFL